MMNPLPVEGLNPTHHGIFIGTRWIDLDQQGTIKNYVFFSSSWNRWMMESRKFHYDVRGFVEMSTLTPGWMCNECVCVYICIYIICMYWHIIDYIYVCICIYYIFIYIYYLVSEIGRAKGHSSLVAIPKLPLSGQAHLEYSGVNKSLHPLVWFGIDPMHFRPNC